MRAMLTIAARELGASFRLPVGWLTLAFFLLVSGIVFGVLVLTPGQPASMRTFFMVAGWLLLPVAPAISMRALSEELRAGTLESLMASPASDAAIVMGKFLACVATLVLMLVPTLAHVLILAGLAQPAMDFGPVLAGYLSLVLVGTFYLAIGLFFSSLTSSQTLAFLGTLFTLLLVLLLPVIPPGTLPEGVRAALAKLAAGSRAGEFARGVVDTGHVVFFLAGAVVFLVATHASVQSRRWR
ncbi:MAG: ABC transporter permease [Planctomycetota bacterium]|nr:ABC transporter permease [Planctomycetota bacterium]